VRGSRLASRDLIRTSTRRVASNRNTARSALGGATGLVEDEAVQRVVGGDRDPLAHAGAARVRQAEQRRARLKTGPDHESVERPGSMAPADRARQRAEPGGGKRPEPPMRELDHRPAAPGGLTRDLLRGSLLNQPHRAPRRPLRPSPRSRPWGRVLLIKTAGTTSEWAALQLALKPRCVSADRSISSDARCAVEPSPSGLDGLASPPAEWTRALRPVGLTFPSRLGLTKRTSCLRRLRSSR
jgi:hypothetical protein